MKANSANIISQLKVATENLNYSCAGDSSVGTYIWELASKDQLSLENMLKLLPVEVDWMDEVYTICEYLVKAVSNYRTIILDEKRFTLGLFQNCFLGTNYCWIGEALSGDWRSIFSLSYP